MEDMKWDMGGAAVTAAIMKYLVRLIQKYLMQVL
jgi:leucyl aminopeptidase